VDNPAAEHHAPAPGAQLRQVAVVLNGLGSVGRAFLRLLVDRRRITAAQHGVDLVLVGVVDSRGAALDAQGLDIDDVLARKDSGASVGELPGSGLPGAGVEQVLAQWRAVGSVPGVLVEASPADLVSGGSGLAGVLAARARGTGVVLANKAPLVLAWDRVVDAAGPPVRYSACAGAALPTVDLLRAAAVSASVERVEIVLNSTCQRLLGDVEAGSTVAHALAAAQQAGLAEADPALDVDGIDTAVKLVVLLRTLGHQVELDQVSITGIRGVTPEQAAAARRAGDVLVLLGTARAGTTWQLEVAPTALPSGHPLARMARDETGLVVHTDVAGTIAASGQHTDVTATAAAVLRDVLVVAGDHATSAGARPPAPPGAPGATVPG
jgi:homoserine dehydrogenase